MIVHALGIPYTVVRGVVPGEDFGLVDYRRQTIIIDEVLGQEEFAETLLHELIHILARAVAIPMEELLVFRLSRALFSVITDADNVDLIATLLGSGWEWEDGVELDPKPHPGLNFDYMKYLERSMEDEDDVDDTPETDWEIHYEPLEDGTLGYINPGNTWSTHDLQIKDDTAGSGLLVTDEAMHAPGKCKCSNEKLSGETEPCGGEDESGSHGDAE